MHFCCGPCAIYPFNKLKEQGLTVEGFFYNPNIHPLAEFEKRKNAVLDLSKRLDIATHFAPHSLDDYLEKIGDSIQKPLRCRLCWELRLQNCAQFARDNNFDYFSTTLLVSPYQDINEIIAIGKNLSGKIGVKFWGEDFRDGFRAAHNLAKSWDLYCQKYCGCFYSLEERNAHK